MYRSRIRYVRIFAHLQIWRRQILKAQRASKICSSKPSTPPKIAAPKIGGANSSEPSAPQARSSNPRVLQAQIRPGASSKPRKSTVSNFPRLLTAKARPHSFHRASTPKKSLFVL